MDTTEAMEKAKQRTGELAEKARGLSGQARSKLRDAGAAADLYVHEYTWTTVLLTALTACVVGFIIGRRD